MPEDDALPVVPVLAYANPRSGQPLDGRLRVELQGNKTIVTDPQSAATSSTLLGLIGLTLVAVALIWGLLTLGSFLAHRTDLPDPSRAVAAMFSAACGAIIMWRASHVKQAPRILEVHDGMVSTTGIPTHGWVQRRLRPRRFLAKGGATDLLTLKRMYSLHVNYGFGFPCLLMPNLSKDEAIWIADLLNAALLPDCQADQSGQNGD